MLEYRRIFHAKVVEPKDCLFASCKYRPEPHTTCLLRDYRTVLLSVHITSSAPSIQTSNGLSVECYTRCIHRHASVVLPCHRSIAQAALRPYVFAQCAGSLEYVLCVGVTPNSNLVAGAYTSPFVQQQTVVAGQHCCIIFVRGTQLHGVGHEAVWVKGLIFNVPCIVTTLAVVFSATVSEHFVDPIVWACQTRMVALLQVSCVLSCMIYDVCTYCLVRCLSE